MKHSDKMTPKDVADLELAATMVKDGKALRRRVLSRIRGRAWRENAKGRTGKHLENPA